MNRKLSAFTLVELLTVLALTAIMLGLILFPIVQSFNFTRAGQAFSDAQQRGRTLIETITREIQNSAGVRDNDGSKGAVAIVLPGDDGTPVTQLVEYAKLDLLKPAQGDPSLRDPVSGAFFNPDTGRFDPTLRAPKGDVRLPVAPGPTIVRYWIGLKDPLEEGTNNPRIYFNPHVDYRRAGNLRWMVPGGEDNLYVVYRAEVETLVPDVNTGNLVPNARFFADADADGQPDLDDPFFFTMNAPGQPVGSPAEQQAKADRIRAWKSRATIVTEVVRYDAIQVLHNKGNRRLETVGNVPRIIPLVQFRPETVSNQPAEGAVALRLGEESDSSAQVAPDVFRTAKRGWSSSAMRLFPGDYDPANVNRNEYLVARLDDRAGARQMRLYVYDPDNDSDGDDRNGDSADLEVFDFAAYDDQIALGRVYPFTRGLAAANARSNWTANPTAVRIFTPLFPDAASGRILASVGIDQWGIDDPAGTTVPRADRNLPSRDTGPELTPTSDGSLGGNFFDAAYSTINRQFNKVWSDNPSLQADGLTHRFLDLRLTQQADGAPSPLHPTTGFPQSSIVPGSEIVIGPDQTPGPNYGRPVRYSRVSRGEPRVNQYKINYTDLVEPDYNLKYGLSAPPATYDPQNFVSAIIQPRYRKGYLQLNSNPNLALPTGTVQVYYRIQFTRPGDTVTVDYDSRDSISVLLTIRNFPQANLPNPQNITLKGSATIRNVIR